MIGWLRLELLLASPGIKSKTTAFRGRQLQIDVAWRISPGSCLNCDQPTLLVNFGLRPTGQFNRSPNLVSACGQCRRSFRDDTVKDVRAWIVSNVDGEFRPGFEMSWTERVKWEMV